MTFAAVLWFLLVGYYRPDGRWATAEVYQVETQKECKKLGMLLIPKDRLTIDEKVYEWRCVNILK